MPDIRIVPANAIMSFTSSLNFIQKITQDVSGSLNLYGSGSTGRTEILSVDGNNGRLFTVSDDLSDSLFSVNTIAGLPVIEAFADNTVKMGQYGQNVLVVTGSRVGIGIATPSASLHIGKGDSSLALFGPNTSYGGRLYVGASPNTITSTAAQVISTDGNLHLDPASSSKTYINYYSQTDTYINAQAGKVGIGTTSPGVKFVNSGAGNSAGPTLGSGTVGSQALLAGNGLYGMYSGVSNSGDVWHQVQRNDANTAAYGLLLQPNGGGVAIGKGTTSPAFQLDITGTGNATSDFRAPIFYDTNDTSYYADPASTSRLFSLNVVQVVNAGYGGNGAPSFSFIGDTNTGMYNPTGTDTLGFTTAGVERLRITAGGAMGLGITPTNTSGRFEASNDIVAYSTSDKRWKTGIKNIGFPLEKISQINGVEFDWIEDEPFHGNKGHDVGVIAQEIELILPEAVQTRESGMKAVQYDKIIPLLIEAIKELQKEIKELKK